VAAGRGLSAERLSPSEALRILADPHALEAYSPFGSPLLVVDMRAAAPAEPQLAERLTAVAAVTVAVTDAAPSPATEGFDCAVVGVEGLDALAACVVARPFASLALVQLLREGAARSIEAGLVAESWVYSMLQAGPEFASWRATRTPREREIDARPPLRVERDGATLALTFDRPEKRNAFSSSLRDALNEALALAALDDGIRAIEITGAGPDFCSGGDLDEFGSFPDVVTAHAARTTRSAARGLARLASRGRVIAAADATFRLPEVTMGLVPGAGGTVSLPRRIGRQRTAWLALTGEALDARTALAWGLVDALA
jgi:hypothetical protein